MTFKILIAAVCLIGLQACKKSFLELSNPNALTSSNFYQTQTDFQQAINGSYSGLRALFGDNTQNSSGALGAWCMGELRSDNTEYVYNKTDLGGLANQQIKDFLDNAFNSTNYKKWQACYYILANVNPILQKIDAANIPDTVKNDVKGEALFLRAYAFFELVQYYGDVPFPITPANSLQSASLPRTPKDTIYTQIIADASAAASLLPSKAVQSPGHATRGSANMLLGYVYMTLQKYPQAESALLLVDNGDYSLEPNYADIFNPSHKNGPESIFEVQYSANVGSNLGSNWAYFFAPRLNDLSVIPGFPAGSSNPVYGGWNVPSASLLAEYEAGDTIRFNASISTMAIVDNQNDTVRYWCKKYLHPHSLNFITDDDWPVYRYGDACLLLAEALNEDGKTTNAIPYILKVRERAGLADATFTATSQDDVRKAIAHERRVELAFENHRWLDLVRTGQAITVMNAYGASIKSNPAYYYLLPSSYNVTQDKLLFPIPAGERQINPSLTQNPGY